MSDAGAAADLGAGVALEPGEREIWAHQARRPLDVAYHVTAAVEIDGDLDEDRLARSLHRLVGEQPALRSVVRRNDDGVWRRYADAGAAELRVADLPVVEGKTPVEERQELIEEAGRPFLPGARLHRFVLWRDPAGSPVLQLTIHHLVCDGLSLRLLLARIRELYRDDPAGDQRAEPAETLAHADLTDPEDATRHWRRRQRLAESQELLPPDGDADSGGRGALLRRRLAPGSATALAERAALLGVSPFSLALSGVAVLVGAVSGAEEFAVRVPFSIRRPDEDRFVSYRVRTLPLLLRVGADTTVAALAEHVQDELHEGAIRLCGDLPLTLGGTGTSIVAVNQLDPPDLPLHFVPERAVRCAGLSWRPFLVHNGSAKFDLSIYIGRDGDRATMALEYRADRYDHASMAAYADLLTGAWTALSERDTGHPALDCVTGTEPPVVGAAHPVPSSLAAEFLRQAEDTPLRPCVIEDGARGAAPRVMTYADLARSARALAGRLLAEGAGPGVVVAVRAPRSCALHVGVYGALLAGAPFLMLDPDLPPERRAHMVADSRATVLVAAPDDGNDGGGEDDGGEEFGSVRLSVRRLRAASPVPLGHADPHDAAYVMYTSGSTGRPKGVVVSQPALLNRLRWAQRAFPLDRCSRVLAKTPISFDVSVWELFWPQLAGAVCVLAGHGRHGDAEYLVDVVERYGIDTVHFVPAMLDAFLAVADRRRCGQLRRVITSGERLTLRQARRLHEHLGVAVHNLYGPTEAAIDVTGWTYDPRDRRTHVPIGRPADNVRIDVRDRYGRSAPVGVRGELVISGDAVALGYVGDGTLDAGRFIAGPGGTRAYRTGDLARWRPGGVLEFLGRTDSQVKVNGQRTELAEIDSALAQCAGVATAAVRHDPDAAPTDRLVAYLRLSPGAHPDARGLRRELSRTLPQHMLPTRFLTVAALPYSPSGKLDRPALATLPAEVLPEHRGAGHVPADGSQRLLAEHVTTLLGVEPAAVAPDSDLFHVGLDSITVLDLVTGLRAAGAEITTADVFETRTIARLAERLACRAAPVDADPPAPSRPARFPLSALQQALLFHHDVSDDYVTYVTTVELHGHVDAGLLRAALAEVAEHHEVLRTEIDAGAPEGPVQVVRTAVEVPLAERDLRHLPGPDQDAVIEAETALARRTPFRWDTAPLFTFTLYRLADDRAMLSVVEPVLDGWSVAVLLRDVLDAYECLHCAAGDRPVPPTARRWRQRRKPPSYAEFVRLEQEAVADPAAREFWRAGIAEAGDVRWQLAVAKDGGTHPDEWHRHDHVFTEREVADLLAVAERLAVPLRTVLLAVHVHLVTTFAGGGQAATAVTVNGRPELPGAADACGLFLNMVPLVVDSQAAPSWSELISAVRDREGAAWRHRRVPYSTIVRDAGIEGCDSVFNFTNFHRYADTVADEERSLRTGTLVGLDQTYFDVTVQCSLDPARKRLRVSVDNRFPTVADSDAERMLAHFAHLVRRLTADPDGRPADVPLPERDARLVQLASGADTTRDRPRLDNLAAVVDDHARVRPDAPAIVDDERTWSYAEVSRASHACAEAIRRVLPSPGVVAVLATRSARLWISVLAIWRAGATYLPLDPGQPPARLAGLLRRAGVRVVVTDDEVGPALSAALAEAGSRTVPVSAADPGAAVGEPAVRPVPECAYVVFTSGSTGEPKGARIGPDAMANHLWGKAELLGLDASSAVAQVAPASFDQSLWQCMAAWLVGARSVVVDEARMLAPGRLVDHLVEHGVTVFETVPSHLGALLESVECGRVRWPAAALGLTHVMVSGEALTAELVTRWFRVSDVPLVNAYGATECADDVTHAVLSAPPADARIPIGTPIPNCAVAVVDTAGRLLPPGVAGELRVSGAAVGLGYLDPAHERGRFEFESTSDGSVHATYRTGDLGLLREDGQLVWLARMDDEVKLNGRRVDLREIEHHLRGCDGVTDAVAVMVDRAGAKRLRCVVTGPSAATGHAGLRAELAQRLPRWMMPDELLVVGALPLTPHGKVDRAALAALSDPADTPAATDVPALTGPGAAAVAAAAGAEWTAILGTDPGPDSDFYADGGTSLDSVRFAARVSARLGTEVDAATVLRNPRFGAFVGLLADRTAPRAGTAAPDRADAVDVVTAGTGLALLDRLPRRRLTAAAVGYVSAQALARTGHTRAEVLDAVAAGQPVLRRVFVTPFGPVGHLLVPLMTSDLFADPGRTAAAVAAAVQAAGEMGARCTALTGMLASSLDYGRLLRPLVPAGSVTTGHDVTAAAVVLNVAEALARTGTGFADHDVAVVGLGSVGRAAVRQAVRVLGRPRRLILVDGPGNLGRAQRVAGELTAAGCDCPVECAQSAPSAVADAAYRATLVIGAASVHGVLDVDRLRPGTVVVDDSSPHLFDVARALARHRNGDLHVTEGGMLTWPADLTELRWQPQDGVLATVLGSLRAHRVGRHLMGCVSAGVLPTFDGAPVPVIGEPDPEHVHRTHRALVEHGFRGTPAIVEDETFAGARS
ncbi:amino acid adenylation domain-containing protein [Actinophytocola sp. KF-1]